MSDLRAAGHDYLTVREVAELLRLKERKVYDLAASGAVPCSRATGKLLFPAGEVRAWVERASSGGAIAARPAQERRHPIILGSHDPLLDWAIRQSRSGLATYFDGSLDGLTRFMAGEGVAAGLHVYDAPSDSWNVKAVLEAVSASDVEQNAVIVAFANRQRGLVFRKHGDVIESLADLAGRRFVPRQAGSGTEQLFHALAGREGLDLTALEPAEIARTEDEAVEAIRRGEADVTFGLSAAATSHGLAFLPIIEEQFALIVDRRAWFEPPIQALMAFFKTRAFEQRAVAYGGYDIGALGQVVWNA